jgi:hypothetical protein
VRPALSGFVIFRLIWCWEKGCCCGGWAKFENSEQKSLLVQARTYALKNTRSFSLGECHEQANRCRQFRWKGG